MGTVQEVAPVLKVLFHLSLISLMGPTPTRRLYRIGVATLNFLVVFTLIGVVFKISDTIYKQTGTLPFLNFAQICDPILVHFVILSEVLLHSNDEVELWSNIAEVEHELEALHTANQGNSTLSQAISKDFVLLCLVALVPEIFIIAGTYKTAPNFFIAWTMRLCSVQMGRFCLLHMNVYRNFILDKFNKMQIELENIRLQNQQWPAAMKMTSSKVYQRTFYQRINDIRRAHNALWKMHFKIRGRFKWSMIVMLMNIFMCLTIGVFWVCSQILRNIESYRIEFFMIVVPLLIMLISHGCTSEGMKRKANKLGAALHKISTGELSNEQLNLLKRFSVQLKYTKTIHDEINLFYINFENLRTISFVLSKYLVILFSLHFL